jgi:hypothetical protein
MGRVTQKDLKQGKRPMIKERGFEKLPLHLQEKRNHKKQQPPK